MRQGATAGLPKKRIGPPSLGGRVVLTQFVQMSVAFQPRAGCVFLEPLDDLNSFNDIAKKCVKSWKTQV